MVVSCAVRGCTNRWQKVGGITFHRFPKDKKLLNLWLNALNRGIDWQPSKYHYVCSVHFEEKNMDRTGQTVRLRENAVPSVFQTRSKGKQMVRSKRKSANNKAVTVKTRHSLRQARAERKVFTEEEELSVNEEIPDNENENTNEELILETKEDEQSEHVTETKKEAEQVLIAQPLMYESFFQQYCSFVTLPSSLWGIHKEPTGVFVAFTHVSELTSNVFISTDKAVMFEGILKAEIFVRGNKVTLPNISQDPLETIEDVNSLLRELEFLNLCEGTGLDAARFSSDCSLYLEKKHRNSRCSNCSLKRTLLKKTEAQRLRRALARQKEQNQTENVSRKCKSDTNLSDETTSIEGINDNTYVDENLHKSNFLDDAEDEGLPDEENDDYS